MIRSRKARRVFACFALFISACLALTGCASLSASADQIARALNGVAATMTTYTQDGSTIDRINGRSFQVQRDTTFDTTDPEGNSKGDSSVLMISLGQSHIYHVGSSMILAQNGLTDVTANMPPKVSVENTQPGTPWLNNLFEKNRNLWQGKAKTIMIRSQNGMPIAVYAGNSVTILSTDVPKSTWFQVDGMYLLVYRADYTVYDTDLIK